MKTSLIMHGFIPCGGICTGMLDNSPSTKMCPWEVARVVLSLCE